MPPLPVSGGFALGQNPLSKAKNGYVRTAALASVSDKVALFKKATLAAKRLQSRFVSERLLKVVGTSL